MLFLSTESEKNIRQNSVGLHDRISKIWIKGQLPELINKWLKIRHSSLTIVNFHDQMLPV